tara:strand:+ start:33534 stop:34253 length:720 start_codon:yes stop_codon:yes gene_type:complete
MVTVILNCYKRPQYLKEQIEAIKNQTIDVDEIIVWYNKPEDEKQYNISGLGARVIMCDSNFKFHGRFAAALLAKSKYVALFDDDTIPGTKWFENCINCMETHPGIYGSSGVVCETEYYEPNYKVGWNGNPNNEEITEVDLVGHAWFMKRQDVEYLWREEPYSWDNGEDMQLSYYAQKYGGVKTYVPPHPTSDIEMWGSKNGMKYGNDFKASWRKSNHMQLRNEIVNRQIENGWKTVKQK